MNQIEKCKILFFLLMFFSDFNVNILLQSQQEKEKGGSSAYF